MNDVFGPLEGMRRLVIDCGEPVDGLAQLGGGCEVGVAQRKARQDRRPDLHLV